MLQIIKNTTIGRNDKIAVPKPNKTIKATSNASSKWNISVNTAKIKHTSTLKVIPHPSQKAPKTPSCAKMHIAYTIPQHIITTK
jgi:hypothetical protein